MPTIERPRVTRRRYAGTDFDTIFDDLVARARVEFGDTFSNFAESDPGVFFMDLMAWATGQLAFYLDRRVSETFIESAQFRKYVARIARRLGYKPGRAVSASTTLSVTLDEVQEFDVTLPVGRVLRSASGLVFEVQSAATWVAGDTSAKSIEVSQGETKSAVFASTGLANQRFDLPGVGESFLLDGSCTVIVDSSEWDEEEMLEITLTDEFEVEYDESPPRIRFGDGVTAGNVPDADAEVRVSYRISSGKLGNVAAGELSTVNGAGLAVPVVVMGSAIGMTFVQANKASGGDDPESIDSIRVNAPKYYASRRVAVTAADYEALGAAFSSAQYGRASNVFAICVRDATHDTTLASLLAVVTGALESVQTELVADLNSIADAIAEIDDANAVVTEQREAVEDAAVTAAAIEAGVSNVVTLMRSYIANMLVQVQQVDSLADDIIDESPSAAVIALTEQVIAVAAELQVLASNMSAQTDALAAPQSSAEALAEDLTGIAGLIEAAEATITASTVVIDTKCDEGNASLTAYDDVVAANVTLVEEHVNELWASACGANIVQVSVLTKDADGFYAAPSNGLMASMQSYFEGLKEVTQSVVVVSGGDALVEATVDVEVVVQSTFVKENVLAEVESQVLELLKDRTQGEVLSLQEVYDLKQEVEGVARMNVQLGPATRLDAAGNLVPLDNEMITRGAVTVTEAS